MSLCEKNCEYNGYNNNNKKAKCDCTIKFEQYSISQLDQKDLFSYKFTDKNDMITMKCYKTLFSKDGLIRNIGSYVLLFSIFLFMVCGILFYKCGYNILEDKIQEIYKLKINRNKKINNIKETTGIKNIEKFGKKSKKNKNKKTKRNNIKKNNEKDNKIKKNKTKSTRNKKYIEINKDNNKDTKSNSKIELKINKFIIFSNNKNNNKIKGKKEKNLKNKVNQINYNYNDYELNLITYEKALKYDKRSLGTYYCGLIKSKHPFIFHFFPVNDNNLMIIKICLFFLSFSIYYFINNLFFDESTIHKIYEEEGIYNFIYLIPHILYSFVISQTLYIIIKYIFLSERNLYEIKEEENIEIIPEKIEKVKKCIIIKYICFFCLNIIFLSFFWYYLSSFGAVFQNTQIYLIKNTLISYGVSLVYPFIINLIPSILRIYSLSNKKRKCLYKISKIIELL